ncbi:glycosyltransferase [bacterium]|nr:glycosyltransferase [bacterium]
MPQDASCDSLATPTSTSLPHTVEVTAIITTLNEEAAIEACLRRTIAVLGDDAEVLVIDGGRDRTGEIVTALSAEFPAIRYVKNVNDRGKGHAVHEALARARGRLLIQIDADLQFLPEEIPLILLPLREQKADLVLGSRFASGATRLPGSTPPLRTFGNWLTSGYASLLFGHRMTDLLAGMKAWRREVTEQIRLVSENCSYDAELPVKTVAAGFRVVDVPVTTDARQGGVSAIRVFRDGRRILWDVTCYRLGLK